MARRRRTDVTQSPRGVPITRMVMAYPVDARGIEVIGPTSDVWGMTGSDRTRSLAAWAERQRSIGLFVWLDPPQDGALATVEAALDLAGVPYKRAPRTAQDVAVPVMVVATPAQVSQSLRDVVEQLADEVSVGWPEPDAILLDETLDLAMSRAGL